MRNTLVNSPSPHKAFQHIVLDHKTPSQELSFWLDKLFKFKQQFYIPANREPWESEQKTGFLNPGISVPRSTPIIGALNYNPSAREMAEELTRTPNQKDAPNEIHIVSDKDENILAYSHFVPLDKTILTIIDNIIEGQTKETGQRGVNLVKSLTNFIITKTPLNSFSETSLSIIRNLLKFKMENPEIKLKPIQNYGTAILPTKQARLAATQLLDSLIKDFKERGITHIAAGHHELNRPSEAIQKNKGFEKISKPINQWGFGPFISTMKTISNTNTHKDS
ncbi:MAG: hypothetical protein HRT47_05415 [Candidatus Caenarcaniphilales bacterium]|nr:hypothetical protein [Candidatus Caenarcaniphilales bacterium]